MITVYVFFESKAKVQAVIVQKNAAHSEKLCSVNWFGQISGFEENWKGTVVPWRAQDSNKKKESPKMRIV